MTKSWKVFVATLVVITAASLIAVAFMAAHRPDTDDEEEVIKQPSNVVVKGGRTIVTLDAETQAREGISVAPVSQTSLRTQLRGTAVVLAVNDLALSRNNYVAAHTRCERARVDLAVSQSTYERVKTLYENNQNMSLRASQEAEAAYRNNQVLLRACEQDAKLQLDTVRQHWGKVVADWIAANQSLLEPVLDQRELLVQVIFPPGEVAKPPATVSLGLPGNQLTSARFVSPCPQVNPQIQGISFLYLVSGRPELAVGMNLVALVPVGQTVSGIVVPHSAAVWWQGKAWAYEQISPTTFTRRELLTDNPVGGGFFVPGAKFAPGTKLVLVGAQALLSQEFRSEIQQQD